MSGEPLRPSRHLISVRRKVAGSSFPLPREAAPWRRRIRSFPFHLAVGEQVVIKSIEFVWLSDEGLGRAGDGMTMRIVFEQHSPWFGDGSEFDVRHEFCAIVTEVQSFPSIPWDPLASSLQTASPASSSPRASSSRSAWS